ncbi:hypothetical protein PR202_ga02893 [Eleusine coracana subsp. coracana]|uniref:Pentatricopeptide repeat-containing protein n=1 Tax=Eleusine coracana subsp. coracana TaxID=191504 RepID=A0AAV5BKN8_ELECO|nr:hypothetical protein PR202_ga02893 [Eleusine coracana subsp. coracana]
MDGAHIAAASSEAGGASSSASSVSSFGSTSRRSWLKKGVHLRRRRPRMAVRGGGGNKGAVDGDVQDLALPLGMSFAAVLAQVLNKCTNSGGRLQPDSLSKMCTSAVKESLTNIYGDRFESFMKNFEKSFGSTLTTLHIINEAPVYQQDIPNSVSETKLSGADSQGRIHDVQKDIPLNSMDNNQIILHAGVNQQLVCLPRSRCTTELDKHILSVFERSVNEQTRSNELKELEIGLTVRDLRLKESQLNLSSYSHMLDKIKISMGLEKASFKKEKFDTQMKDSRYAELLRKLIDMHLTAVVLMSVCFGYGTYTYSYQRITAVTAACAAASRMPFSSNNKDIIWYFDASINCLVDIPAICNDWTKHASSILPRSSYFSLLECQPGAGARLGHKLMAVAAAPSHALPQPPRPAPEPRRARLRAPRDVVSWTSYIARAARQGNLNAVAAALAAMLSSPAAPAPNDVTVLAVLSACADSPSSPQARRLALALHALAVKLFPSHLLLSTCLARFYLASRLPHLALQLFGRMPDRSVLTYNTMISGLMRNGLVAEAFKVFDGMPGPDEVSWTALIDGCVKNGRHDEAIDCFRAMLMDGVEPDYVTLIAVVSACAEVGALGLGMWVHRFIVRRGLERKVRVANSLIDMYARCGQVELAAQGNASVGISTAFSVLIVGVPSV